MTFRKIAICGKRHSGKGTLSYWLGTYGILRLGLADPLKDTYVTMYNVFLESVGLPPTFSREQLEAEKEIHRVDLQRLGTDHGRRYDDKLWINLFLKEAREIEAFGAAGVAADDVRFLNEVEALRENGFVVVKMVRDEQERIASISASLMNQLSPKYGFEDHDPYEPVVLDQAAHGRWHALLDETNRLMDETLHHPSEQEVDLIEADICVANLGVDALVRVAFELAT